MSAKQLGEKTEAIVLAELIKRDIPVSLPFGDNQRYDLLMDVEGVIYKVQVKTANFKTDYFEFKTASTNNLTGERRDYKNEIDYFITYCHEMNDLFLVPIHITPSRLMTLRINPSKNNQSKNIFWAKHFQIDEMMRQIGISAVA